MAKAGGTYPSIIGGVSGKQPHRRNPGQTSEQINFISDPVYGVARRQGTTFAARLPLTISDALAEEMRTMDVFDFTQNGIEYALLYRRNASTSGRATFCFCFDKTNKQWLPVVTENSDWINTLAAGGASSVVSAGAYVYIAGNTTIPTATQTNLWEAQSNKQELSVWFRSGKYGTLYTLTLTKTDGTTQSFTYTTATAAYPGVLDTSDIPFYETDGTTPRPDYQKDINDRENEYTNAQNQWIRTSAEDVQPSNIASKFVQQLQAADIAATVFNSAILISDADYIDVSIDDDGDNTTAYANGQEITDATYVNKYHFHGKILRVRPSNGAQDESFYLQAILDNGNTSGYGAVSWFETAGIAATITDFVAQLMIYNGSAYLARNGLGLTSLAPASGDHPAYVDRHVGDNLTSPLPHFIGKPITMLDLFQDRLVVGSENYVNTSQSSDYFDFFRGSVAAQANDDPIEIYAFGSEGDVLRSSVLYNGNLIIFGDRQQYGIDGTQVLAPQTALIRAISANRDTKYSRPKASGNFIFYTQYGVEDGPSCHQMRVGALNGQQTYTDELSDELADAWFHGQPLQVVPLESPYLVQFRMADQPNNFYLYFYSDQKMTGQRTWEAWNKYGYDESLGPIIGLSWYEKSSVVFTARATGLVADYQNWGLDASDLPALDTRVAYAQRTDTGATGGSVTAGGAEPLVGVPIANIAELIEYAGSTTGFQFGVVSDAVYVPTNPFPRDQNGQAVLDGRMSLSKLTVDVIDTAGLLASVVTINGTHKTTDFEGRILGRTDAAAFGQPIYTGQLTVGVGKEVRECSVKFQSKDWLPCQITGLNWTGQTFNNVRRVS